MYISQASTICGTKFWVYVCNYSGISNHVTLTWLKAHTCTLLSYEYNHMYATYMYPMLATYRRNDICMYVKV